MTISEITKELLKPEKFYILTHTNPDGDAMGSSFALCDFLRSLGKTADVVLEKPVPECYSFMEIEEKLPHEATEKRSVVVLDCGDLNRVGKTLSVYENADRTLVLDHHATNPGYGDFCLVLGEMSSTGEIVFNVIEESGFDINHRVAFLLYTSIMSDTGGLRYSCATPRTVKAVAKLMEHEIDTAFICRMLFENNPLRKIKLQSMVLSTLNVVCDGKAAVIKMTRDMLEKSGATDDDTEGFVNIPRSIEGVEVGVFLKEKENEVRVSLRSNAYADVSIIAAKLGGGGHFHAGGCSVKGTIAEAEETVLEQVTMLLQGK